MKRFVIYVWFALSIFTPAAVAGTIISQPGGNGGLYTLGSSVEQVFVIGWSSQSAYTNVSVGAEVSNVNTTQSVIDAYLTTSIGPLETDSDIIASTTYNPQSLNQFATFFTGLSLGPGSYYLVVTGGYTDATYSAWWTATDTRANDPLSMDAGVSLIGEGYSGLNIGGEASFAQSNGANPPASQFFFTPGTNLEFTVKGDLATPEPNSAVFLLGWMILALAIMPRIRRALRSATEA